MDTPAGGKNEVKSVPFRIGTGEKSNLEVPFRRSVGRSGTAGRQENGDFFSFVCGQQQIEGGSVKELQADEFVYTRVSLSRQGPGLKVATDRKARVWP